MTRTRKTILIVGICVILLLPTLWLIWFAVERHRLNVALADLRTHGEPTSFAELAPPAVPDDQNAVIIYEQAYARYDAVPNETWQPLRKLMNQNKPLTEDNVKEACRLLDAYSEVFFLIHQAGQKPSFRLAVDYSDPNPIAHRMGELPHLQNLVSLLRFAAKIDLAQSRHDEATASASELLRISRGLLATPDQIPLAAGIGDEYVGLNILQTVLDQSDPPEPTLRSLLSSLPNFDQRAPLIVGLKAERASWLMVLRNAPASLRNMNSEPSIFDSPFAPLLKPILDREATLYVKATGTLISLAQKPSSQSLKPMDQYIQDFVRTRHPMTLGILLPGFSSTTISYDRELAKRGLARTAIALRLYRMKNNSYPDSLSQLTPDYLPKLPIDPFSGKDFIYKKSGPGFILYPLGQNLTDDGGVEDPHDRTLGDIVWKCSR